MFGFFAFVRICLCCHTLFVNMFSSREVKIDLELWNLPENPLKWRKGEKEILRNKKQFASSELLFLQI